MNAGEVWSSALGAKLYSTSNRLPLEAELIKADMVMWLYSGTVAMLISKQGASKLVRAHSDHGFSAPVDWWTLGCLLVEMLTGRPPFLATNLPDLMELIKTGTPSFLTSAKLGAEAKDCCAKLLERKPEDRLGCGEGLGVKALEAHPFFADVPWRSLEAKRETPPFLPDPATDVMGRVHALSEQTENVAKPLFDDFRAFNRDSMELS